LTQAVAQAGYRLAPFGVEAPAEPAAALAGEQRSRRWRAVLAWPLALAVPYLALAYPRQPAASYAAWALATPVQFALGRPILRSAALRARARQNEARAKGRASRDHRAAAVGRQAGPGARGRR
jgi:cation-transporting ATPase V/Cu+-exporting ATPase